MDLWELIKNFGPYLFTVLVLIFGLVPVLRKLGTAIGATGTATTEAGDFLFSIQEMLKDGAITEDELEKARKEWTEMIEAGKVAADKWQAVFMEVLLKIRASRFRASR